MNDLEAGIAAAKSLRYLSKTQAMALVVEIERLREELERERTMSDSKIFPDEARAKAWDTYITVEDERGESLPGHPGERLLRCDLCGATTWQPVVWIALAGGPS